MLKRCLLRSWGVLFGARLLFAAGCETVPYTGRSQLMFYDMNDDIATGEEVYAAILSEEPEDPNSIYLPLLQQVGWRIADVADRPQFNWEFKVIDSDVVNAWCAPGGKVGFYPPIFAYFDNEAELAVVMSHEVAHALARHSMERQSQGVLQALGSLPLMLLFEEGEDLDTALSLYGIATSVAAVLPYSRKHESEADEIGLYLMAQAGYDPAAAVPFWEKFGGSDSTSFIDVFLSTHPPGPDRVAHLKECMVEAYRYYEKAPVKYGYGETMPRK